MEYFTIGLFYVSKPSRVILRWEGPKVDHPSLSVRRWIQGGKLTITPSPFTGVFSKDFWKVEVQIVFRFMSLKKKKSFVNFLSPKPPPFLKYFRIHHYPYSNFITIIKIINFDILLIERHWCVHTGQLYINWRFFSTYYFIHIFNPCY